MSADWSPGEDLKRIADCLERIEAKLHPAAVPAAAGDPIVALEQALRTKEATDFASATLSTTDDDESEEL